VRATIAQWPTSGGPSAAYRGSTGQCDIAEQICQKAAMCSVGGDAGVVFVIGPDEEASINSYPFSVNSEPGCEVLIGSGCNGSHAVAFTANCGSAISSGLQCGSSGEPRRKRFPDSHFVLAEYIVALRLGHSQSAVPPICARRAYRLLPVNGARRLTFGTRQTSRATGAALELVFFPYVSDHSTIGRRLRRGGGDGEGCYRTAIRTHAVRTD
jgi:hypothetical protein